MATDRTVAMAAGSAVCAAPVPAWISKPILLTYDASAMMRSLAVVGAVAGAVVLSLAARSPAAVGFRQLTNTHPVAVQRGTTAEVQVRSVLTLDDTYAVLFAQGGIHMSYAEDKPVASPLGARGASGVPFRFQVQVPEDQPPGVYEFRVATRQAVSSAGQLLVTDFPVVLEDLKQPNGTPQTAQSVAWPVAICGLCEQFEDVDCYRLEGEAGQELTIEIYAQRVTDRLHSMVVRGPRIYLMDPILTLYGPNGQVVAQNDNYFGGDSFLHVRLPLRGTYTLEVRDARYAGNDRYSYCVEISDRPYVRAPFPLVVQQGESTDVELVGYNLGDAPRVTVRGDEHPAGFWRVRFSTSRGLTNPAPLGTSPLPQVLETEPNDALQAAQRIELPLGINGRLQAADDVDYYALQAVRGHTYRFEVQSHRHALPTDSVLELYDAQGKLLAEADDLTALHTKDSLLVWTAPADGTYYVALRDLHGRGGPEFVYHLQVEEQQPDFELFGEYYYAFLAPGTRMIWFARLQRQGGFRGPVAIEVENLPQGVTYTPVTIPEGMDHCAIILSADPSAPIDAALVRVRGRATVDDGAGGTREIIRYGRVTCEQQSSGGGQSRWPIETQIVGVTAPLDLKSVVATPDEIALRPGEKAEIEVRIERAEDFTDPVTLAMSFDYFTQTFGAQLPPGVTMTSASTTRLAGKQLEGKIVLAADDKALPVERLPIAVMARVSISFSITTNYASNPVYLTVLPAEAKK